QAFRYRGKLSFRGDLWVDPAAPLLRAGGQACPEAVLHQGKGEWLVPARDAFAALNAKVSWDAKQREVVVTAGSLQSGVPKNSAAYSVWKVIGATFESWAEEYLGKPVAHMIVDSPLEIRFLVDPRPMSVYDPAAKKTRTRPCYLAYVNGRRYVLYDPAVPAGRVAPRVVNGRFCLPAGVFADLLGAKVTWNDGTGELRIDGLRFWQTP
uniref:copper amine oxidase N-terminal domain-containing protein n=1 Tax=Thermodesulfitimonas autotrophica TaxID=1894989 RepID=UPI002FE3C853